MLVNDDEPPPPPSPPSVLRCLPSLFFCCRRGAARALDEGEWIEPILPGRQRRASDASVGASNGPPSPASVMEWEDDGASKGRFERTASAGKAESAKSRGSVRSDWVRRMNKQDMQERKRLARRVRWSDHPLVPFAEEKLDDDGPSAFQQVRQGGCGAVDAEAEDASNDSDGTAETEDGSESSDGTAEEKKDDGDYGMLKTSITGRYDSIAATAKRDDVSARLQVSVLTAMDQRAVEDYVDAWRLKNEWPELDRYARHL